MRNIVIEASIKNSMKIDCERNRITAGPGHTGRTKLINLFFLYSIKV